MQDTESGFDRVRVGLVDCGSDVHARVCAVREISFWGLGLGNQHLLLGVRVSTPVLVLGSQPACSFRFRICHCSCEEEAVGPAFATHYV